MKTTFTPRNFLVAAFFIFVSIPLVYGATPAPAQQVSGISSLHYVNEQSLPNAQYIRTSYDLMRPTFDILAQCDRYQQDDGSGQDLEFALKKGGFAYGGFGDTKIYMQDIWIHPAGWVVRVKSKGTRYDHAEYTIGYNDQNLWHLKTTASRGDFLSALKNADGEILKVTFAKDHVGPLAPAFGKQKSRVQWSNTTDTCQVLTSAHHTFQMSPYFLRKGYYITHHDYAA